MFSEPGLQNTSGFWVHERDLAGSHSFFGVSLVNNAKKTFFIDIFPKKEQETD